MDRASKTKKKTQQTYQDVKPQSAQPLLADLHGRKPPPKNQGIWE
jgi:hypothetical protein